MLQCFPTLITLNTQVKWSLHLGLGKSPLKGMALVRGKNVEKLRCLTLTMKCTIFTFKVPLDVSKLKFVGMRCIYSRYERGIAGDLNN